MADSKSTVYFTMLFTILFAVILVLVSPIVSASDETYLCSPLMQFTPNIQKVGFDAVKGEPIFKDMTDYKCKVTWYCDETYTATDSLSLCKTVDIKSKFTKPPARSVSETGFVTYTMSVESFFACDSDPSKYYGPYVKENFGYNIDCRALKKALDDAKEAVKNACKEDESEENDACADYRNEMDAAEQALSNAQSELAALESELFELRNRLDEEKGELATLKSNYEILKQKVEVAKKKYDTELERLKNYRWAFGAEVVDVWVSTAISLTPFGWAAAITKSIYYRNPAYLLGSPMLLPVVRTGATIVRGVRNVDAANTRIENAERDRDAAKSDLNLAVELLNDWLASPQGVRMKQLEEEIPLFEGRILDKQNELFSKIEPMTKLKEEYESKKAVYEACLKEEEVKAAEAKKAKEAEEKAAKAACEAAKAKEKAASDRFLECASGK